MIRIVRGVRNKRRIKVTSSTWFILLSHFRDICQIKIIYLEIQQRKANHATTGAFLTQETNRTESVLPTDAINTEQ